LILLKAKTCTTSQDKTVTVVGYWQLLVWSAVILEDSLR